MDEITTYSSDSSDTEAILLYYLWRKKHRSKQKKRRTWVRQMFLDREKLGEYHRLVPQLFEDPKKFYEYFGMNMESFKLLTSTVKPYFSIGNTNFRASIQFEERLVVTIRYLMTGLSFHSLSNLFRISHNKISTIVNEMMLLIYEALESKYMKYPTRKALLRISKDFYATTKFPNCLGAIDAKLVRIKKQFVSNEQENSTVLLAVVDANYKFVMVEVATGDDLDKGQFEKILFEDRIKLPNERRLTENNDDTFPYVFVGDTAFRLAENLLKPYPNREVDIRTRNYNKRLSDVHEFVGKAFLLLAGKFRIFELNHLPVYAERVDRLVKCACILYNMVRVEENTPIEDEPQVKPGSFLPIKNSRYTSQSTKAARIVREMYCQYFQDDEILGNCSVET